MAEVLGGDFYDFIELEDGCQVVLIGDVTGHGLHASVVMSLVYGFIHNAARQRCEPSEVVSGLNEFLRRFAQRSEQLDHFFSATLFFGIIDPASMTMRYVNAGHPAGLVRRGDEVMPLAATSHPVGYFDRAEFSDEAFSFEIGDRLLLYTDGLVDSTNRQGQVFGSDRLEEAFVRLDGDHMSFLDRLFAEINDFLGGTPPFDDCTAIVIDLHRALARRGG
jgi:serine phosphatase RsbU (regulator of sigma subunit)